MSRRQTKPAVGIPSSSTLSGGLFPAKLSDMIDFAEHNGLASTTISWTPNGFAFIVHDPDKLVETLLGIFFEQTKYRSFLRQLSMWSFERTNIPLIGSGLQAFRHPYFIRGQKSIFENMSREVFRTSNKALTAAISSKSPGRCKSLILPATPKETKVRRAKSIEAARSAIDVKVKPANFKTTLNKKPPTEETSSSSVSDEKCIKEVDSQSHAASSTSNFSFAAQHNMMMQPSPPTMADTTISKSNGNFDVSLQGALMMSGKTLDDQMTSINAAFNPKPIGTGATFISMTAGNRHVGIPEQPLSLPFASRWPYGTTTAPSRKQPVISETVQHVQTNNNIQVADKSQDNPHDDPYDFEGMIYYSPEPLDL